MSRILKRLDDLAERMLFDVLVPAAKRHALLLVLIAVGSVAASVGYRAAQPAPVPPAAVVAEAGEEVQDAVFLLERPWIDQVKGDGERQKWSLWYFSDQGKGDQLFSVAHKGAGAKWLSEVFGFRPDGNKLHLRSLFDKKHHEVHYRITREKNEWADLKLVLKGDPNHGGKDHVYWSRRDRFRRGRDEVDPDVLARVLLTGLPSRSE
jgi:hypothetical protein